MCREAETQRTHSLKKIQLLFKSRLKFVLRMASLGLVAILFPFEKQPVYVVVHYVMIFKGHSLMNVINQ